MSRLAGAHIQFIPCWLGPGFRLIDPHGELTGDLSAKPLTSKRSLGGLSCATMRANFTTVTVRALDLVQGHSGKKWSWKNSSKRHAGNAPASWSRNCVESSAWVAHESVGLRVQPDHHGFGGTGSDRGRCSATSRFHQHDIGRNSHMGALRIGGASGLSDVPSMVELTIESVSEAMDGG